MKQLLVAAIENGTVIDHIPPDKVYQIADLLGVHQLETTVMIANNLQCKDGSRKGIIKLSNKFFSSEEINRMAILAPTLTLNLIQDYQVVEKRAVQLPPEVIGLIRCPNPKCISRNEPMESHFYSEGKRGTFTCKYCGRIVLEDSIELL